MTSSSTQGIKTVLHPVSDLAKAKAVYTALLGVPPQNDDSYYVGYEVEGQHIGLSTECYIVRHADHTWWHIAGALGLLKPETLVNVGSMMRPRDLETVKASKVA